MTVFLCVDDDLGLTFNNRRQSRDSAVTKRIAEMSLGGRLLMDKYSSRIFGGYEIVIDEDFLEDAEKNDYCFVERADLKAYADKIETLIVFKWNRAYPSDRKAENIFDGKTLNESFDFEGSSHKKITCEVWTK